MSAFQRLFVVAALAGSLAGLLTAVVHHFATVPLILKAEAFELAAASPHDPDTHADAGHPNDGGWQPHDGLKRIAATTLTEIATGVGFALLLVALSELCGQRLNWRRGLSWGLGGFAAVTLAPALGLPPELPGTESAPLLDRQLWWVATAVLTAAGLGLVFLVRKPLPALAGAGLTVLPHLYGAPQPLVHSSSAPEALAHEFAVAAILASLLFWMALGLLAGFFEDHLPTPASREDAPA